jgi:ribosomal protein S7
MPPIRLLARATANINPHVATTKTECGVITILIFQSKAYHYGHPTL